MARPIRWRSKRGPSKRKPAIKYGSWIEALLYRPLPHSAKIAGENLIHRQVYLLLCDMVKDGRYRGTFLHPSNEAVMDQGRMARFRIVLLLGLGMVPGATDWILVWRRPDGQVDAGFIELKQPKKYLEPIQRHFRDWVTSYGLNHAVCRSEAEFHAKLVEWGAIWPATDA